eukprot:3351306-Rhodomonas_salina.2
MLCSDNWSYREERTGKVWQSTRADRQLTRAAVVVGEQVGEAAGGGVRDGRGAERAGKQAPHRSEPLQALGRPRLDPHHPHLLLPHLLQRRSPRGNLAVLPPSRCIAAEKMSASVSFFCNGAD